jgi:ferredoxin-NADP reductase/Na+-transporting NADH:ubiquinone oxidoreductase subunit NqrB
MKPATKNPVVMLHAWIDKTAMYMIVLYMLSILVVCSIVAGALNLVGVSAISQICALVVVLITGYGVSVLAAKIRGITANHHSSIITALIIFFLLLPDMTVNGMAILAGTVAFAVISKYVIVYRGQHVMNPAALSVFVLGLTGLGFAAWWVDTVWMFVPLMVTGSIVVMKVRKWVPVVSFLLAGLLMATIESGVQGISETWYSFFISSPVLFLGFFMLTEPFSIPPTKRLQVGYGILVGFLSNTSLVNPLLNIVSNKLIMSPELALLVGNIVFYPSTLRRKLFLVLESKREVAASTWEFVFTKPGTMLFKAGQYLEWMLPHDSADIRGIRRYFTIASSPTEGKIRLALRVMNPGSSYKASLLALPVGGTVVASQRAGDFTLPKDTTKKIGMIAGGIGVTPFRSQVKYMMDTNSSTNTQLFYCANTKGDMAYVDLWAEASSRIPFTLVPVLAKEPESPDYEIGFLTADILKRRSPDLLERTWYVSGPPPMVSATVKTLKGLGVPRRQIVQDFFPGLA